MRSAEGDEGRSGLAKCRRKYNLPTSGFHDRGRGTYGFHPRGDKEKEEGSLEAARQSRQHLPSPVMTSHMACWTSSGDKYKGKQTVHTLAKP